MLRCDSDGLVTYRFDSFQMCGLAHAVFTRLGGVSKGPFATLNVGNSVGDDRHAVAENHSRIYAHLDVEAGSVVSARQVHGNRVAIVGADNQGHVCADTDGLVTTTPGIALMLRFADCQPILLYDSEHHALGLVHAGWRGIAQGIVRRAVERMGEAFGSRPEDLVVGLGPAIGPCCYTVGHDVATAMAYALPDWRKVMEPAGDGWRFDLSAANAQQLAAAGAKHVEQAHLCTACHTDEFFSHRAESGRTGRFGVVAYLTHRASKEPRQPLVKPAARPAPGLETEDVSLYPPGFPSFHELPGDGR